MKNFIKVIIMLFGVGLIVSLTCKFLNKKKTDNTTNSSNVNSNNGTGVNNSDREVVGYKHNISLQVNFESYDLSPIDPNTGVGEVTTDTHLSYDIEFELNTDTNYSESFGEDNPMFGTTDGFDNFINYLSRNESEDLADYSFHLANDNLVPHSSGTVYDYSYMYDGNIDQPEENPSIYYVLFLSDEIYISIEDASSVNDLEETDFIPLPSNGQTLTNGSDSVTVVYYFSDTVTPIYA